MRPRIAPAEQLPKFRICLGWVRPVVRRPGFLFCWCADKSELLDTRDVVRIRPVQIRARNFLLVQLDQDVLLERLSDQKLVLALRAVAPENVLGLCQRRDLLHPIEHSLVGGLCITDPLGREYGGREILHRTKPSSLTMNLPSSRLQRDRCTPISVKNHEAKYMTKFEITPSVVSLAQEQCAALIENMFGVTTSDDYRPVAWMGRYPVDVTTMLVGIHVAAAILAAILVASEPGLFCFWLCNSTVPRSGPAARCGGCLPMPSFMPLSDCFGSPSRCTCLFVFGREVERFLGRRAYIALYVSLLLTPAALLTIWGLWERCAIAGSPALHFGIFVAFATIYPRVELLLRIHGEVGRADSGRHLHSSTTRLSRLERSGRCSGRALASHSFSSN